MKNKGMRKVLSYLLVLCLVITLMPCASFADEQAAQELHQERKSSPPASAIRAAISCHSFCILFVSM